MAKKNTPPAAKPKASAVIPPDDAQPDDVSQQNDQSEDASNAGDQSDQGAPDDAQPDGKIPDQPATDTDKPKKSDHVRIHCALPNASESINGIAFVEGKGGMVSEAVTREVAARFVAIHGYTIIEK